MAIVSASTGTPERPMRVASGPLAEPRIVRAQPDRETEGRRVLQGAMQDQRVADRDVGLAEADATGFGQLGHLGDRFAAEAARQGAERKDPRQIETAGAKLEHLD